MPKIKAIQTEYKNRLFRSRLEARWAVYFDKLGIEWEYELEGFNIDGRAYLPDFYLKTFDCWAEVKPKKLTKTEFDKCLKLGNCLLLDGMPDSNAGFLYTGFLDGEYWLGDYERYLNTSPISAFGYVLLNISAKKKRLWFLFGETANAYDFDTSADRAALQARFEHGEKPM